MLISAAIKAQPFRNENHDIIVWHHGTHLSRSSESLAF
jgi:hypothetical protein